MKWIGQHVYDLASKFRNTVDFSEDVTFYQPVNNANPTISIGASDDERFRILVNYQGTTTQEAQIVSLKTFTEGSAANDGRFQFIPDGVHVLSVDDGGIDFEAGFGISINGTDIITDSSGTATLSNIDALDVTTIATFEDAMEANLDAIPNLTSIGTIATGVWNGTAIASAYLDADTAHLSTGQTFTGINAFGSAVQLNSSTGPKVSIDGNTTMDPAVGAAAINIDAFDVTDAATSASGTAAIFMHVGVEAPRLLATNSSVTTTTASTLYVKGPPVASTNQTITHAYSLLVDSGDVRIDEDLIVGGNIDLEGDIDVNGTLETDALTIGGAAVLAQATASAVGAVELATTAEADTGTDTARAITAAGLKSHVDTRYSYSYITLSASAKPTKDGSDNPEWMVPNINKGIYEEDWNKDTGITSTTVGATAYALGRYTAVNSFIIPHAGILVGFRAIGRNGTADRTFKAGLLHADNGFGGAGADGNAGEGIDYGSTGSNHEFSLRCIATAVETEASSGADGTTSHDFRGPCQLISNSANLQLQAGDALMPAIMGNDTGATDEIFMSMTIILKIPLA